MQDISDRLATYVVGLASLAAMDLMAVFYVCWCRTYPTSYLYCILPKGFKISIDP